MRTVFACVLALHGLIHLLGFAKAFRLAELPQLTAPISRGMGLVWLAAGVLTIAASALGALAPRWHWPVGALAIVLSQVAITRSWSDARFGTIANLIALGVLVHAAFAHGPLGLRAEYRGLTQSVLDAVAATSAERRAPITEADLAPLPVPVQAYLRFAGVIGTPRPLGFRATMRGRIRGSAQAQWMEFTAEQHNLFDPPRRYFWMDAERGGLPIDGLHVYGEGGASMRVRLLSLVPVVRQDGAVMTQAETVTLLNDMAVFAPGALLDPAITWRAIDARRAEATYSNGPHTIRAELVFGDDGALADFWSEDRPALAEDGVTMLEQRWSTPITGYAQQGPFRLPSRGEARYAAPSGDYAYIEFDGIEVEAL